MNKQKVLKKETSTKEKNELLDTWDCTNEQRKLWISGAHATLKESMNTC